MKHYILLIDDDPGFLQSTKTFLEGEGFFVKAISHPEEGIALVKQKTIPFSLGLIDYHMPEISGADVIRRIRELDPNLTLIAFSGDKSDEVHNLTLRSGAIFFVSKGSSDMKLLGIIHRICQEVEHRFKPIQIIDETDRRKIIESVNLTSVSHHMAEVANLILKFAPTSASVLIRGENGTGKEKIAKAIHAHSPRANKPFIAVNCASIPANLIESELFGHEKGAFTGADAKKDGKFQAADKGTIFLDEIGDMPHHLQATLLRVLEEMTVMPVGSNTAKKLDVRVIAATNAPLEQKIDRDQFRRDLFHRLNALPIHVLPLRERTEDIPVLAKRFIEEANHDHQKQKILTPQVADELKRMPWPGNVRELKNAITRMVLLSEGSSLDLSVLKTPSASKGSAPAKSKHYESFRFNTVNEERRLIQQALEKSHGNISAAARELQMNISTFRDKMKKYGFKVNQPDKDPNQEIGA